MTISHHPPDTLLTAFAAGTLELGQHIAVATHANGCAACRRWLLMIECVGGCVLESLPPARMARDALSLVESRLDKSPEMTAPKIEQDADILADIPGLPPFVRRYPAGEWKWIAPGMHLLPLHVAKARDTRVFLLKARQGLNLLPHAHTGSEMTCVLAGSFGHDGERYGAGDFDLGDPDTDHAISIGPEEDCLCLVTMAGELRLKGLVGRLVQPFVSI